MSHQHSLEVLVADRGYVVQYCATCEIVHVDVGPVTLRLRPGALDSLAQVLARAGARLHERITTEDDEIIDIRDLMTN